MYICRAHLLATFFVGCFVANGAFAAEFSRDVTIDKMLSIAEARPAQQQSSNTIRIYVNVANWGTSSCRTDAADLRASDKHLLATLLAAWTAGKQVTIAVDDTLRPVDTVCQVTWLSAR